ncbi:MAG TPA: glycosyltransferase [Candidatus Binatia bacterium]|nr:glycosyltransferase [Candidatus Binatia bacterium]
MTGGGSGGHITPLLSLAQELKRQQPDCQLVYIGHKGDKPKVSDKNFDRVFYINAGKFRRYHDDSLWRKLTDFKTIALNIRDFFRLLTSIGSAYRILSRVKPDALFSKGGFVSVPVGLAARIKGIPIITHDSDAIGGLANQIVGRWATVRASGMPSDEPGVRYVGIPLDAHIAAISAPDQKTFKKQLDIPKDAKLLLLTGGGNGSVHLNQLLVSAAPQLLSQDANLYIAHMTGHQHLQATEHAYQRALTPEQQRRVLRRDFVSDLYKYSAAADLIISRAGATVIAEFAVQGKACIIIPSPFLAGGHQLKNAKVLADADAAVILSEDADATDLIVLVQKLLADSARREQLAKNLHGLSKSDAAEELAKIIIQTAGA